MFLNLEKRAGRERKNQSKFGLSSFIRSRVFYIGLLLSTLGIAFNPKIINAKECGAWENYIAVSTGEEKQHKESMYIWNISKPRDFVHIWDMFIEPLTYIKAEVLEDKGDYVLPITHSILYEWSREYWDVDLAQKRVTIDDHVNYQIRLAFSKAISQVEVRGWTDRSRFMKEILDRVAYLLVYDMSFLKLDIEGYASSDGEPERNKDLSIRRAWKAAKVFSEISIDAGVNLDTYIRYRGCGEIPFNKEEVQELKTLARELSIVVKDNPVWLDYVFKKYDYQEINDESIYERLRLIIGGKRKSEIDALIAGNKKVVMYPIPIGLVGVGVIIILFIGNKVRVYYKKQKEQKSMEERKILKKIDK